LTSAFCSQTAPSSVSNPTCSISTDTLQLGNGGLPSSGALAASSEVTHAYTGIMYNPVCTTSDQTFTLQTYSSGDYLIDQGTITFAGSNFTTSAASFVTSSTTHNSNQPATITITITHPVRIRTSSVLSISIPTDFYWKSGTSSCTVSGTPTTSPTAICSMPGSNEIQITGAFTADKDTNTTITLNLTNVYNPRSVATHTFTNSNLVKLNTCTYIDGNFDYAVSTLTTIGTLAITTTSTTYYVS